MNKAKQYIEFATVERVRSRGLILKAVIEATRIQREETKCHAIEVYKQVCPSRNCKRCASRIHKQETKSTRCDGNRARIGLYTIWGIQCKWGDTSEAYMVGLTTNDIEAARQKLRDYYQCDEILFNYYELIE